MRLTITFLKRCLRAGKLILRDRRIPRPIRWLAFVALLPIPGPVDDLLAVVVFALVFVCYRQALRDAWAGAAA